MKKQIGGRILLMGLLLLPSKGFSAEADLETIRTIAVGSADVIEVEADVGGVTIGNKTIVETNPKSARSVYAIPIKKGTTSVVVTGKDGKILKKMVYNVITNELSAKVMSIRRLLRDVEGITVESENDQIVVDGEILDPAEMDRIVKVVKRYPDALNLVKVSKGVYKNRAEDMQKAIRRDPSSGTVGVEFVNGTYILSGRVPREADRKRAQVIAETFLPEFQTSDAIKIGAISHGAPKFSIRNLIEVGKP